MPMNTTLNVSELLKRLGVVGDSLGSAPVLEQLRLGVSIADLSQLVPPLRGPVGSGSAVQTSGIGNLNKWSVQSRAQGGIQILSMESSGVVTGQKEFRVSITDVSPFGAATPIAIQQFSFGQVADSVMAIHPAAALQSPVSAVRVNFMWLQEFSKNIWVGPGLFLNVESVFLNNTEVMEITWKEYTGALNP